LNNKYSKQRIIIIPLSGGMNAISIPFVAFTIGAQKRMASRLPENASKNASDSLAGVIMMGIQLSMASSSAYATSTELRIETANVNFFTIAPKK
jgi:hypothetical protein